MCEVDAIGKKAHCGGPGFLTALLILATKENNSFTAGALPKACSPAKKGSGVSFLVTVCQNNCVERRMIRERGWGGGLMSGGARLSSCYGPAR